MRAVSPRAVSPALPVWLSTSPAGDGDTACSRSTCRHAPFNPFRGLLQQEWQLQYLDPVEVVLALIEHGLHYLRSSGSGTHFNRTWFGVSLGYWRLRFSVGGPWEEVTERSSVRGTGGVSCSVLLFFTLNFPHLVVIEALWSNYFSLCC